jgi:hypothetical protein
MNYISITNWKLHMKKFTFCSSSETPDLCFKKFIKNKKWSNTYLLESRHQILDWWTLSGSDSNGRLCWCSCNWCNGNWCWCSRLKFIFNYHKSTGPVLPVCFSFLKKFLGESSKKVKSQLVRAIFTEETFVASSEEVPLYVKILCESEKLLYLKKWNK